MRAPVQARIASEFEKNRRTAGATVWDGELDVTTQTAPADAKRDLWIRLKHYHFDHIVPPHLTDHVIAMFGKTDVSTKAFASKLARKLNWPTKFALQAIDEYKKFVFLGIVSKSPVTPPKVIDQVWHEHILFSRAYREFCNDILRREFDHHPELVAMDAQTGVFQAQYEATLDLYETEFGYPPPVAIWGTPKFKRNAAGSPAVKPKRSATETASASDDAPLYMFVGSWGDDSCGSGDHHHSSHGGAHHSDSGGHHSSDAGGGHDSGGGGGDAGGGGDGGGGGSGCSSGCGSGGCGGS